MKRRAAIALVLMSLCGCTRVVVKAPAHVREDLIINTIVIDPCTVGQRGGMPEAIAETLRVRYGYDVKSYEWTLAFCDSILREWPERWRGPCYCSAKLDEFSSAGVDVFITCWPHYNQQGRFTGSETLAVSTRDPHYRTDTSTSIEVFADDPPDSSVFAPIVHAGLTANALAKAFANPGAESGLWDWRERPMLEEIPGDPRFGIPDPAVRR